MKPNLFSACGDDNDKFEIGINPNDLMSVYKNNEEVKKKKENQKVFGGRNQKSRTGCWLNKVWNESVNNQKSIK